MVLRGGWRLEADTAASYLVDGGGLEHGDEVTLPVGLPHEETGWVGGVLTHEAGPWVGVFDNLHTAQASSQLSNAASAVGPVTHVPR